MDIRLKQILKNFEIDKDGIYGVPFENGEQEDEIKLREREANQLYSDYLDEISNHHSIPVMDYEVKRALNLTPVNGIIVDVGGCWGWHWRNLEEERSDVSVIIVDFIHANLHHAKKVLGNLINNKVFLVCSDANKLLFPDNSFDLYWSVQTLQHIPNFSCAVFESHRILKPKAAFLNYSLNNSVLVKCVYYFFGKHYHIEGNVPGAFYLSRANEQQKKHIKNIFHNSVKERYCEIFFQPDLKLKIGSKFRSIIGAIDSRISGSFFFLKWVARQKAFQTFK